MARTDLDDRYRRRREAGEDSRRRTRVRLVEAADDLFRDRGYAATTVSAIAERAGVSLQTLYLVCGSKRDVFRAAAMTAAGGTDARAWPEAVGAELAADAGGSPGTDAYLRAVARVSVAVTARTTPYRRLYQEAVVVEPDLLEDWRTVQAEADAALQRAAHGVPTGALRPGLEADDVVLTVWTLASPEVFDVATGRGGRSPAEFEQWLAGTLVAALTRPQRRDR